MKKYLAIVACAGLLLTVTGCGNDAEEKGSSKDDNKVVEVKNKVLTCSFSHYNRDIVDDQIFTYDSEGKNITKLTMTLISNLDDLQPSFVRKIEEAEDYSTLCSEHTYAPLKSCDAKLEGDTFTANMEVDLDKMDGDKNIPIDELKKQMEDNSTEDSVITCTIEEK